MLVRSGPAPSWAVDEVSPLSSHLCQSSLAADCGSSHFRNEGRRQSRTCRTLSRFAPDTSFESELRFRHRLLVGRTFAHEGQNEVRSKQGYGDHFSHRRDWKPRPSGIEEVLIGQNFRTHPQCAAEAE